MKQSVPHNQQKKLPVFLLLLIFCMLLFLIAYISWQGHRQTSGYVHDLCGCINADERIVLGELCYEFQKRFTVELYCIAARTEKEVESLHINRRESRDNYLLLIVTTDKGDIRLDMPEEAHAPDASRIADELRKVINPNVIEYDPGGSLINGANVIFSLYEKLQESSRL